MTKTRALKLAFPSALTWRVNCDNPVTRNQMFRSVALRRKGQVFLRHTPCYQHRTFFNSLGIFPGQDSDSDTGLSEKHHERKILPYTQAQMYNVVADVGSYRHFIPYCSRSRVLSQKAGENGVVDMQGELTVAFMGMEETYISNVHCRPNELVQAIASTETPLFKSLITTWSFQSASTKSPHPTADVIETYQRKSHSNNRRDGPTLVTFDIEFAFANPLHARISAAFSSKIAKRMIDAFESRCLLLYGPGTE